eukprot:Pgem_evm1s8695
MTKVKPAPLGISKSMQVMDENPKAERQRPAFLKAKSYKILTSTKETTLESGDLSPENKSPSDSPITSPCPLSPRPKYKNLFSTKKKVVRKTSISEFQGENQELWDNLSSWLQKTKLRDLTLPHDLD